MKIEEAIRILQGFAGTSGFTPNWDVTRSIKLGIEALKVFKAVRPYSNSNHSYYLPGESKD